MEEPSVENEVVLGWVPGGMGEHRRQRVRSLSMVGLDGLCAAQTLSEVVARVVEMFGSGARLYAIDHAFDQLVSVDGRDPVVESVDLGGDARNAFLAARPVLIDGWLWVPLPERAQSVFVVRTDADFVVDGVSAALMGAVMGVHRNRFEDLERSRRRADMSIAAEMQWSFLPQSADSLGGFDVASVLEPAYQVAGDVFDYAVSDGALWVYSFDGMGHGLDATLASVLALSAVRNVRREGGSLGDQMSWASRVLFDQHGGDRFVTGAGCCIDADGVVSVVNAGHEPVRLVAGSGVQRLDLRADLPLGVTEAVSYGEQGGPTLGFGDGLVLLSDGSAESLSVGGEVFGADRLDATLEAEWTTTPLQTGYGVVDCVLEFIGSGEVADDITAVVVRRRVGDEAMS